MVYLLHFTRPYRNARHFLLVPSSQADASAIERGEIPTHTHGLLRAAADNGSAFVIARTWSHGETTKRALKTSSSAGRLCPMCRAERKSGRAS